MLIYVKINKKKKFLSDRQTHVQLKTIVRNFTKLLKKSVLPHIIIYFIKMEFNHILSWNISVRFRVYSSSITKAAFAFE
jgi:hypothetical protein